MLHTSKAALGAAPAIAPTLGFWTLTSSAEWLAAYPQVRSTGLTQRWCHQRKATGLPASSFCSVLHAVDSPCAIWARSRCSVYRSNHPDDPRPDKCPRPRSCGPSTTLRNPANKAKFPKSPKHRRCDLGRSESKGAAAPNLHRRRFFCARDVVLWRWCAGHLRVCRAPFVPVGQPAYCCHLNLLGRERWQFHNERNSCMPTHTPSRIPASAPHRRLPPPPNPQRFHSPTNLPNPTFPQQVPHD